NNDLFKSHTPMKPVKGLIPFAIWLIRLTIVFFIFTEFLKPLKTFNFTSIRFYASIAFYLFASLLLIGGFMKKPSITVLSGLMLFLASVYEIIIRSSSGILSEIAQFSVIATISFYFFTAGNKK
ncbi:MAG TPA: hypothetical protein PLC59_05205, partial [Bacteroidales bacterium]|nr:hypothetical protein [Bacteroidales bacterium]